MTLYDDKKEKCAVCRKESTFMVLTSTNSFGSPDLDLRPAGQERHSISFRLQECKYCGYVNTSIGKFKANSEKTMSEPAFIDIQNEHIKVQSFKKFFKASLFAENANELGQAAYYSLCSAWSSDDVNNAAYSDLGRTRALQLFQRYLAEHNLSEEDALRAQIFGCWSVPLGLPFDKDLLVRLKLELKKDGTILKSEIVDHQRMNMPGQKFYKILAESALRAVRLCQPLKVPPTGYEKWKNIQLNFDPTEMLKG